MKLFDALGAGLDRLKVLECDVAQMFVRVAADVIRARLSLNCLEAEAREYRYLPELPIGP